MLFSVIAKCPLEKSQDLKVRLKFKYVCACHFIIFRTACFKSSQVVSVFFVIYLFLKDSILNLQDFGRPESVQTIKKFQH